MEKKKLRRALAIAALVFMAIFTVTFIIVLVDPGFCHGAFGYAALISVLLGVGLFLVVKFVMKDAPPPAYLPTPDGSDDTADTQEPSGDEQTADEPKQETLPQSEDENSDG